VGTSVVRALAAIGAVLGLLLIGAAPAAAADQVVRPASCPWNDPSYQMVSVGEAVVALPVTVGAFVDFNATSYAATYYDVGICVGEGTYWLEPKARLAFGGFEYGVVVEPGGGGSPASYEVDVYPSGEVCVLVPVVTNGDYVCVNDGLA